MDQSAESEIHFKLGETVALLRVFRPGAQKGSQWAPKDRRQGKQATFENSLGRPGLRARISCEGHGQAEVEFQRRQ